MAHTLTWGNNNTLEILPDSSSASDVNFGTYFPKGAIINFIGFKGKVNDKVAIFNGAAAGVPLLYETDVTGGGLQVYPCMKAIPFLDISGCSFSSDSSVAITIGFRFRG